MPATAFAVSSGTYWFKWTVFTGRHPAFMQGANVSRGQFAGGNRRVFSRLPEEMDFVTIRKIRQKALVSPTYFGRFRRIQF
jgi:hypothetical protein